jgi:hypothetical protein
MAVVVPLVSRCVMEESWLVDGQAKRRKEVMKRPGKVKVREG